MYERILQKLMKQRKESSNVSDRSLQDLAKSLVNIITTDALLELADLSAAIESIDGNLRHHTKIELERIKKEGDEAEAETARLAKIAEDKSKADGTPNIAKEVADAVALAMKPLMGEITSLKTEKVGTARKEKMEITLKGMPDYFTKPILAGFDKTSFTTEEQFVEYFTEIESSKTTFIQTAKEHNLPMGTPDTNTKVIVEDGQTPALSDALKVSQDAAAEQEKLKT